MSEPYEVSSSFSDMTPSTDEEVEDFVKNGKEVVVNTENFRTIYYVMGDRILVYSNEPRKVDVQKASKSMRLVD